MLSSRHVRSVIPALALATAMTAPAVAAQRPDIDHVRGVVTAVADDSVTVDTGSGQKKIALSDGTRFVGAEKASLADVKDGTFIGAANVPGAGANAAKALELVIFPAAMKGTGEGDYPWDLPANGSESSVGAMKMSTMTNGTVTKTDGGNMKMSTMTNGTVTKTDGGDMKMSTMTNGTVTKAAGSSYVVDYGSGSKTIEVPADAPVVRFVPAHKDDLMKGDHVFVAATQGDDPQAKTVIVGEHGTVPPM